jgi:hypothetical protein
MNVEPDTSGASCRRGSDRKHRNVGESFGRPYSFGPSPFADGAAAFPFLPALAFGLRISLFERFCPLAMIDSLDGDPERSMELRSLFD